MKQNFLKFLLVTMILATVLAACASPGGQETPQPTDGSGPVTQPEDQPEIVFDPNDPLVAIKKFLYEQYGIAPSDVLLISKMEQEWSDSCLGLGGPEEMCLQVITPGFVVVVETPQGSYTFHTAASLENFRLNTTLGPLPGRFDAAARFQWLLAGRLNIPFDQVTIVSRESVDWPNACLGVDEPGIVCAQVITPGYRLTLSTPEGEVVIHTDANMVYYQTPQPLPGEDRDLLVWERSGGIAGICERLTIAFDGAYELTDCRSETLVVKGVLDTAKFEELAAKAITYGVTTWKLVPPAGSADMFIDGYTFHGLGSLKAGEPEQVDLAEFFDQLVVHIKSQPTIK